MFRWITFGAGGLAIYAATHTLYRLWVEASTIDYLDILLKSKQRSRAALESKSKTKRKFSNEATTLYSTLYQVGIDELRLRANIHDSRYSCFHCHKSSLTDWVSTWPQFQGVRYVCAQCQDISICEDCEREGVHEKAHILYKVNYNVPFELDRRIACGQLPWQSQQNLSYYAFNSETSNLHFEQIKSINDMLTYNASTSDIEALYEQFSRLADTALDLIEFEGLGGISTISLIDILAVRYIGDNNPLAKFVCGIYDTDNDGIVSFPEYVKGHDLIINAPDEKRVIHFVNYLRSTLERGFLYSILDVESLESSHLEAEDIYALGLKVRLNSLLFTYQDMSNRAFADAMTLLQFEKSKFDKESKDEENFNNKNNDQTCVEEHLQSLLWEDRTEIDSLAFCDCGDANPKSGIDIPLIWDISIEEFVDEIVKTTVPSSGDSPEEFWTLLAKELMASPKFLGMINALFETALV